MKKMNLYTAANSTQKTWFREKYVSTLSKNKPNSCLFPNWVCFSKSFWNIPTIFIIVLNLNKGLIVLIESILLVQPLMISLIKIEIFDVEEIGNSFKTILEFWKVLIVVACFVKSYIWIINSNISKETVLWWSST